MSLTSDDLADIKQLVQAVVQQGVADIHTRLDAMDKRFDAMDKRFDAMDKRFDAMDQRFDEADIVQNEILNTIGTDLAKHTAGLQDHETRIKTLEHKAA